MHKKEVKLLPPDAMLSRKMHRNQFSVAAVSDPAGGYSAPRPHSKIGAYFEVKGKVSLLLRGE